MDMFLFLLDRYLQVELQSYMDKSVFNLVRNYQTVLQNCWTSLHTLVNTCESLTLDVPRIFNDVSLYFYFSFW